jgi:hypothetical protein
MKRLVSLMLTIILLLTMVGPAMAAPITDEVSLLKASGKLSNDVLNYVHIDLNLIETAGTVTAVVYETAYETQTVNTFTNLNPQTPESCYDKLTRFIFELTNRYRPSTDLALEIFRDERTVGAWVYGEYKDQATYALLTGIPDCLNNEPYSRPPSGGGSSGGKSSGSSWIDPYSPEEIGTDPIKSFQVTTFAINEKTYTVTHSTTAAVEEEAITPTVQTMDVAPYIKEDRTYVPVRYLAYSLGVAEDDVTWDGAARRVGISKDDTDIALIIGSPVMQVNKSSVRMDVSPEITNDRTFLPARWVAEALGAEVEWDDTTKQAIIKMPIESED